MTANVQMSIPFSDYILSFGNASFRPQCPSDTMTYVAKTPENGSELQFSQNQARPAKIGVSCRVPSLVSDCNEVVSEFQTGLLVPGWVAEAGPRWGDSLRLGAVNQLCIDCSCPLACPVSAPACELGEVNAVAGAITGVQAQKLSFCDVAKTRAFIRVDMLL